MTTVSRSQVTTAKDAGDGLAVGRQVFRSHLVQTPEHLDANSKPNPVDNVQLQCSWLRRKWVSPWSNLCVFETIRAAELRTRCNLSVVFFGAVNMVAGGQRPPSRKLWHIAGSKRRCWLPEKTKCLWQETSSLRQRQQNSTFNCTQWQICSLRN